MFTFLTTTLGSGTIEFPEFIAMMENKLKDTDEDDLHEAFRVFDRRGKGHIDAKEFHKVMVSLDEENLTIEEVEEIMERIDFSGNGRIKYEGMYSCLLYTSPSPRDGLLSRMPSSA